MQIHSFNKPLLIIPSVDIALEYSIQNTNIPFLSHLASINDTPSTIQDQIRLRCRTALFLQGSTRYDPELLRDKLKPQETILAFEIAILDGKVCHFLYRIRVTVIDL